MKAEGLLFVFSGPSGAGKNTIMQAVMETEDNLHQLPTATTRPRRSYEKDGREHEFLTEDEFRQRIINKELIEWQIIHDKGVYGVPRATVQRLIKQGEVAVADVDVLGAMALKKEFGDHVVLIFVEPPDVSTIERRLRDRGDVTTELELQTRLRRADFEMSFKSDYDYVITNMDGQLEQSVGKTRDIVRTEMKNRQHTPPSIPGWSADKLHCVSTAMIVHQGCLLQHNDALPRTNVANDTMPFESLQTYLSTYFEDSFLPTRAHADKRVVDEGFEAPQLVVATPEDNGYVLRDHMYILQPAQPLDALPDGWSWVSIDTLDLSETMQHLLLEAVGDLQN